MTSENLDAPEHDYYSCEWLEGGLAFNRRSLHACLIVHHGVGMPHFAHYNGEDLPLEDILAVREKLLEQHRRGEINEACKGCAHLQKRAWKKPAKTFDIIGIAQYSHCNIECNYCFLQTQDPASFRDGFKPYRIKPAIQKMYDDGLLANDAIIDWGGGEPSVYREFDEIAQMSLARGAIHYVHTNSVRFPEWVRDNPHVARLNIITSVDAGRPETYKAMKARDYLEQVWQNLESYIKAGCPVTLKYIMREDNCSAQDLVPFVERAAAIGARNLIVDIDYDFPKPSNLVIQALAKLKYLGLHAGLDVRYGFTGDFFAVEHRVEERLKAAFQEEQLNAVAALLRRHNYCVSQTIDKDVTTLVDTLEAHCIEKDKELQMLYQHCAEKDATIQTLTDKLASRRATEQSPFSISANPVLKDLRERCNTAALAARASKSLSWVSARTSSAWYRLIKRSQRF